MTACDYKDCPMPLRWISSGGFHWCDDHKPALVRPLIKGIGHTKGCIEDSFDYGDGCRCWMAGL